jgi:hypothetical protein
MDQFDIVFGKQLETRSHTFTANAMALPFIIQFDKPEDFLEFIKGKNSSELRSKRFRLVEMDGSLDPLRGPFCARLFIKVEDHGTPIKDIPFLIMDLYQLACVHPDTPDWVISVGYSERYQPGEQNPALLIEGESFIRNMQFIPLNKN